MADRIKTPQRCPHPNLWSLWNVNLHSNVEFADMTKDQEKIILGYNDRPSIITRRMKDD